MNDNERKTFLETKLRNLERKYAKMIQHADLLAETEEIDAEIKAIRNELNSQ